MYWTQVHHGDINAADQRLWVALGDNAGDVVVRINTDPVFVAYIARLMVDEVKFTSKANTSLNVQWLRARKIMDKNFFGVEEVIEHFGINPTGPQLNALAEVPFSEEQLLSCKDTHILVAVFPLSILDICAHASKQSDRTLLLCSEYGRQAFARDKGEVGWQLVRKEPIANSTSKTWYDQQALLSEGEETPTARIVVYTMVGHFFATGERLFDKTYVRCVDLALDGCHALVGHFKSDGLHIDVWNDFHHHGDMGLSATRKPLLLIH